MGKRKLTPRHDHRRSLWIIAGGSVIWCYRCGAWRMNAKQSPWHRPTGKSGANPATTKMKEAK